MRHCCEIYKMENASGRNINSRYLILQVFDSLRKEQSNMLEKIAVVAGDVSQEGFGLSPADLLLLVENVSIVFNLAATGILKIKFKM